MLKILLTVALAAVGVGLLYLAAPISLDRTEVVATFVLMALSCFVVAALLWERRGPRNEVD